MNHRLKKKKGKVLNEELWNLDITICDYIIPRLERFRDTTYSYPSDENIHSIEEWRAALDKMIKGFKMARQDQLFDMQDCWDDYCQLKISHEEFKQRQTAFEEEKQECLKVFIEYLNHLWM